MKIHDAIEQAYKNGFEAGVASVLKCGQWKAMYNQDDKITGWVHYECGRMTHELYKYCPTCGAKMSLEK